MSSLDVTINGFSMLPGSKIRNYNPLSTQTLEQTAASQVKSSYLRYFIRMHFFNAPSSHIGGMLGNVRHR